MTSLASQSRRPRGIVKINGQPVSFLSAQVESKSHMSADTWHVKLEARNQPQGYGMLYWADSVNVQVEIFFGVLQTGDDVSGNPSSVTSIVLGMVDDVQIDPFESNSLIISGRDLAGQLIDQKTTNRYPDHVSSWIATKIAQQFGLTPQVTATTTPVGQYYNNSYSGIGRDISYWDLLKSLADEEDFDLYVRGSTLYFGPPQADTDKNPLIINVTNDGGVITSNAAQLTLHRSLTIAQDIVVTVICHNVTSGKPIKAVASRKSKGGGSGKLNYKIRKPGLSQQQAQNFADSTLANITKFERSISLRMQGDAAITVQNRVVIAGTQTSFDQSYYIGQITRTLDFEGGFAMSIEGRNISEESSPVS